MSVSCCIRHEDFNFSEEEISVLLCSHLFHQSCMGKWLNTNSTCPECRISVTKKNFVQKIYPSINEDADLFYKGSSSETQSMLKMYTEKIVHLENIYIKLTDDLQKCSDEKELVKNRNIKLVEDLQKSIDEKKLVEVTNLELKEKLQNSLNAKDVVEQKNLLLILKIEHLKDHSKEIKNLTEQNKKIKKKLYSVMKLIIDEYSSGSNDEEGVSNEANILSTSQLNAFVNIV